MGITGSQLYSLLVFIIFVKTKLFYSRIGRHPRDSREEDETQVGGAGQSQLGDRSEMEEDGEEVNQDDGVVSFHMQV